MTEPQPDPNPPSTTTDAEEIAGEHGGAFDIATDRLEECRRQFEETGNGVYAWEGILICTGRYMERFGGIPSRSFPNWLTTYLGEAASGIVSLGDLNNPSTRPDRAAAGGDDKVYQDALSAWHSQKIKPTEAPDMAMNALKLDAPGTANRFAQYCADTKNLATGILVKFLGRQAVFKGSGKKDIGSIDKQYALAKRIRPRLKNHSIQKD